MQKSPHELLSGTDDAYLLLIKDIFKFRGQKTCLRVKKGALIFVLRERLFYKPRDQRKIYTRRDMGAREQANQPCFLTVAALHTRVTEARLSGSGYFRCANTYDAPYESLSARNAPLSWL
jgi:hypothetical protein